MIGMPNSKLLTIAVPAYNAASYLHTCLDSLVRSGDEVEVLVVNDGSKDGTLQVARDYAERYPGIVVAVDQENRNWGGAVNHALELASGTFFYIVDSDDWLDSAKLTEVVSRLRMLEEQQAGVDLYMVNYVYNRVENGDRHTISYEKLLPSDKVVGWDAMSNPSLDQYIMIHSAIYRTSVVSESGLVLPEGMSYMDSLLMLKPLRFVKKLYYHDCDLYWYTIGREGQSIDPSVLKRHTRFMRRIWRLTVLIMKSCRRLALVWRVARCGIFPRCSPFRLSICSRLIRPNPSRIIRSSGATFARVILCCAASFASRWRVWLIVKRHSVAGLRNAATV